MSREVDAHRAAAIGMASPSPQRPLTRLEIGMRNLQALESGSLMEEHAEVAPVPEAIDEAPRELARRRSEVLTSAKEAAFERGDFDEAARLAGKVDALRGMK